MEKVPQNSAKVGGSPVEESLEGATKKAPAFQLKAGNSAAPNVAQRASTPSGPIKTLQDILTMFPVPKGKTVRESVRQWQITNTQEFADLMDTSLEWQRDFKLSYIQAFDICYAVLEDLAGAKKVDWKVDARKFVNAAVTKEAPEEQLAPANKAAIGGLQPLVDTFEKEIIAAKTVADIQKIVDTTAPKLWTEGCKQTQKPVDAGARSDMSMFWARTTMRRILRTNTILKQEKNLAQMQALIRTLEEKSRGAGDITGFATADKGLKRILITGFDPWYSSGGADIKSNPSGIIAQRLDGKQVKYNGKENAIIESVMLPVRYDDFDKGMVEQFVGPIINEPKNNVSMVITISLAAGSGTINLDRFAANVRGGYRDNDGVGTSMYDHSPFDYPPYFYRSGTVNSTAIGDKLTATEYADKAAEVTDFIVKRYPKAGTVPTIPTISTKAELVAFLEGPITSYYQTIARTHFQPKGDNGAEFIETNMPLEDIMKDPKTSKSVRVNQGFEEMDGKGKINAVHELAKTSAEVKAGKKPDPSNAALSGGGGDYLSNEIFHRVSTLRKAGGDVIRNIHIHIPQEGDNIEGESKTFTAARIEQEVRDIIGVMANQK